MNAEEEQVLNELRTPIVPFLTIYVDESGNIRFMIEGSDVAPTIAIKAVNDKIADLKGQMGSLYDGSVARTSALTKYKHMAMAHIMILRKRYEALDAVERHGHLPPKLRTQVIEAIKMFPQERLHLLNALEDLFFALDDLPDDEIPRAAKDAMRRVRILRKKMAEDVEKESKIVIANELPPMRKTQ